MEEKRTFKTLVKSDHKLGKDDYVKGRISGIAEIMCGGDPNDWYATIHEISGSEIYVTRCTEAQYEEFAKKMEELYPGLCVLDYKD